MSKNVRFNPEFFILFLSSLFFLILNIRTLYNYDSSYDKHILFFNSIIVIITVIFYYLSTKRIFNFNSVINIIFISLTILSFIFIHSLCPPYIVFDAVHELINISAHPDNLFHSTIAENIISNGYPSTLQGGTQYLHYHVLSHYLIALLSILSDTPCFLVYHYIYPQVFISIFLFLFFKFFYSINKFFDNSCIPLLVAYCIIFYYIGSVNSFHIVSQSYFTSIVILLFIVNLIIKYNNFYLSCGNLALFNISIFICLLSFAKVSTSYIFTVISIYYVFRNYNFNFLRKLYIILVFIIVFFISSSITSVGDNHDIHFNLSYISVKMFNGQYFIFFLISQFLLIINTSSVNNILKYISIKRKRFFFNEILFVSYFSTIFPLCISSFLQKTSAFVYFLLPVTFLGIMLIFVVYMSTIYNAMARLSQTNIKNYLLILINIFIISIIFVKGYPYLVYNKIKDNVVSNQEYTKSRRYKLIKKIRDISDNDRNKYGIFANEDIFQQKNPMSSVYYYTSFTGICQYNALYLKDNAIISRNGGNAQYYGITDSVVALNNNLDSAMESAANDGKRFLFYIKSHDLFLIDLLTKDKTLIAY